LNNNALIVFTVVSLYKITL